MDLRKARARRRQRETHRFHLEERLQMLRLRRLANADTRTSWEWLTATSLSSLVIFDVSVTRYPLAPIFALSFPKRVRERAGKDLRHKYIS